MSKMFKSNKRAFYHGLGCEMIKLEIISLKNIRNEMIIQRRHEKGALKRVMQIKARGGDTSEVNFKLFGAAVMGYTEQIKALEGRIAYLKDCYYDLYNQIYTKVTGKQCASSPSRHEYKFRRSHGENVLSDRDVARGVKNYCRPNVIPGAPVDVSTVNTSKLQPIVLYTEKGPTYAQKE